MWLKVPKTIQKLNIGDIEDNIGHQTKASFGILLYYCWINHRGRVRDDSSVLLSENCIKIDLSKIMLLIHLELSDIMP